VPGTDVLVIPFQDDHAPGGGVFLKLRNCLAGLAEDKRDVLVLRLMEHRTNQEIATLLGIPANTVAVRYKRALEQLRAELPPGLYDEICGVSG
jgi:DNA-directed RNA polymerase specialized sigma24 family protein